MLKSKSKISAKKNLYKYGLYQYLRKAQPNMHSLFGIFTFLTITEYTPELWIILEYSYYGPWQNFHILDHFRILTFWIFPERLHSDPFHRCYILDFWGPGHGGGVGRKLPKDSPSGKED